MKRKTKYLLLLLALAGCEKQVDWPADGPPERLVIVDGSIIDRRGKQTVTLAYPVTELNAVPEPVSGAVVRISSPDSSWELTEEPVGSGKYLTSPAFIAGTGKTYSLFISSGNRIYSAQASMVPGSEFAALTWAKNSDDNLYHVDYVASAFSTVKPAMWELLIDWSHVPGYEQADTNLCKARMLFYTLPTLDVSEIFAPAVEAISFPAGTIIEERRYSLTDEHAEFLREMLLETSWSGGFFNSAPANVSTNLSSGAAGFFGASAMTTLSVTVTP
jgi:hypothetical protein